MAERTQKPKTSTERTTNEATEASVDVAASTAAGDKLIAELDDLLDEIDEVLESNAEEFVKSYVQKGGR